MQNNNNNRKILNSKKDSLPAAEVQNNAINYRYKKSATSIKRSNTNNKNHNTNIINNNNTNVINSTNGKCNNAKTTAANHFHTKLYKPNGYTKQIATTVAASSATISSPSTKLSIPTIAETTITAIPQIFGSQETTDNGLMVVQTKRTAGTLGNGLGGANLKSKAILSETVSSNQIDTISSSSQHKQSQQYSSSSHKARHHSFNGNTTGSAISSDRGAVAGGGTGSGIGSEEAMPVTNKTKKSIAPIISETLTTTPTTTTALAIVQKQSTALAVHASTTANTTTTSTTTSTLTKTKTTSTLTSTSLSVASNGNVSNINTNTNSNGGGGGGNSVNNVTNVTNNSNKNFQIPSDVLDDLASRFVINVPDMELSNLIRICFQIELAHWFYLDFFCTGTDEEKELLKPVGMKYFAMQLFQHIPFLSQHLPIIDSVLEDWKNYKLAVPTFGAILISEDLQYCLLVQSYFAKSSWGFPKGKVNETEDPEHCATREVFEETGYDITGLIVPKDYIEAVINDQYTRLYIVCNVSLDTVFAPRTRNEIRCCVWFQIDSLPNNKNDAISKAKLGQNANSFFMILPFVKRLKKWVNEKRAKVGITDSNNGGATGAGIGLVTSVNSNNSNNNANINNNNNNNTNKSNDRRKYSTNNCQNNTTTVSGAILKSPSLGYVGETLFNSGKKNRQQQQQQQKTTVNNTYNNKSNNVAGCFELIKIETTFGAVGANAVAASAAANTRSKRQRHKSMGDLDNMNAFNTSIINSNKNSHSCNKNIFINSNQSSNNNNNKRNSVQMKINIVSGNDNHHNNDNAVHNNGGSIRRQLFHSQSQNDGVISESAGDTNKTVSSSFSLIRQERQQQQPRVSDNSKYVQQKQKTDKIQNFTEDLSINDEQTRKHIRQRAKSQSDKACNNNNQQQQLQTINNCYFSNNSNKSNKNNTTSRPNLQRQSSLITARSTILKTTSNIVNIDEKAKVGDNGEVDTDANNKNDNNTVCIDENNDTSHKKTSYIDNNGAGGEIIGDKKLLGQQRLRRYTTATATAPIITGNDLIAWSAAFSQQNTATKAKTTTLNNSTNQPKIIKSVVEASAIETRLIEEHKLMRQLEGEKPQQQKQEIFPFMLAVQQQQEIPEQQQQLFSFTQQFQQHQHHPLQHSASSPGVIYRLATFFYLKNSNCRTELHLVRKIFLLNTSIV